MKSGHLKSLTIRQRIGIIIVLTLFSIALHEFGHFIVYSLAGAPVHVSLQSVRPTGNVDASLDRWAKFAGPGISWLAAITFLAIAAKNPGFAWTTTAAFTNASIRLFPCVMDFVRAVRGRPPFSDEGDVALALTKSSPGRASLILLAIAVSVVLTVLAARNYRFVEKPVLKSAGVYFLSLTVGIAVVIVDELVNR
jgi:hypothetical protein